jgi:hypothetical protein
MKLPNLQRDNLDEACHPDCRATQVNQQATPVLLRLRRALGRGGAGDPGHGVTSTCHIQGGIDAWKKANDPLAR